MISSSNLYQEQELLTSLISQLSILISIQLQNNLSRLLYSFEKFEER